MEWFLLESLIALVVLLAIVGWTMRPYLRRRREDEAVEAPRASDAPVER